MKDKGVDEMNEHTLEDDWQHFLSYSGYRQEDDATKEKLKQAFIAAWSPSLSHENRSNPVTTEKENCPKCGHPIYEHPWSDDELCSACLDEDRENLCELTRDDIENINAKSELEALRSRLTATEAALSAARGLIAYRDANTLNFQLEKADDFLRPIRVALDKLDETKPTP